MTSYTQLMALSREQTQASDVAAATAAAQLQRKLDEQKKARAVREAKEKELELRLRKKRLEEAAREEERQARKEQERQQKLQAIARREAQQRDALLYGPKKAKAESSRQRSGDGAKASRSKPPRNSESPEPSNGPVLTREELREQKRQAEMRRAYADTPATKRSSASSASKRKYPKGHMPGGAVPIVTTTVGLPADLDSISGNSVKEKITNVPLTLTKLNIVKRDVRTIDEIIRDRARERQGGQVISGHEAKQFSDWFTNSKAKKKDSTSSSQPPSRKQTPPSASSSQTDSSQKSTSSGSRSGSVVTASSATSISAKSQLAKSQPLVVPAKISTTARSSSPYTTTVVKVPAKINPTSFFSKSAPALSGGISGSTSSAIKKRPRSPSFSPEPMPKKRALGSSGGSAARSSYLPDDVFSLITGGRNRSAYSHNGVDSDDSSDMEADIALQEEEERIRWVPYLGLTSVFFIADCSRLSVQELLRKRTSWLSLSLSDMRRRRNDVDYRRSAKSPPLRLLPRRNSDRPMTLLSNRLLCLNPSRRSSI
jgi:protein SPT2